MAELLLGVVLVLAVGAVLAFLIYAVKHSPTARRGKYSCYSTDANGKLCVRPISAERARAGRSCEQCECDLSKGSSEEERLDRR